MPRARTTDILFMGLAFAVLYFLLRSAGQTPDGLSYALAIREGADMYHPHHLLYVPVSRFLFLVTGGRDAILAGVLHNLIWLMALGFGAWRLAGLLRWSHGATLLAAGALLASRGVLFYATHVETYLPALACLTLFTATWFKPQRSDLEAAAWLALAVLYHQTNVMLVVPMLVTSDRRRRDFSRVVVPAGALVLILSVVGWRLEAVGTGFGPWLLTYARADVPAWGSLAHFSVAGVKELGLSQLRQILPVPEAIAGGEAVALVAILAGLTAHHLRQSHRRQQRLFALIFLWVYLLFFLWWIPSDPDFFLATLLPLWWLALLLIGDLAPRWRGRWLLGPVGLLLLGNLWFTARPMSRDPGPLHVRARLVDQVVAADTVVIVGYGLEQELLYHAGRQKVYEGDAVALRLAAGEGLPWVAGEVGLERDYLRLMLSRRGDHDLLLLRELFHYRDDRDDGPTCRASRDLPHEGGVLITAHSQPAVGWEEFLRQLAKRVGL